MSVINKLRSVSSSTQKKEGYMEGGALAPEVLAPVFEREVKIDCRLLLQLSLVIYRVGINKEPIEEWLEKYKPSTVCKDEGYQWICVLRKNPNDSEEDESEEDDDNDSEDDDDDDDDDDDSEELEDDWEALKASDKKICKERIFELAEKFELTAGKWMFWVSPGGKGDHFWSLIAKGIAEGKTLANQAKISALEKTGPDTNHVVCIYNDNFLDKEEVFESERTIRSLGIKCPLHYKPDIYTYLGVYKKNPWKIKPTIYTSNFDVLKNQSIIKEN